MKAKIQQLLASKQIKKVIYVDDVFGKESFKNNVLSFFIGNGDKIEEYGFKAGLSIEVQFKDWWNAVDEEGVLQIAHDCKIEREKGALERILEDLLPVHCLECLPLSRFNTDAIKREAKQEEQYLILMDEELGKNERKGSDIVSVLENEQFIMCGVFSATFTPGEEIEKWKEFGYKTNVYPISKKRFDDENSESIIGGLKNVVWIKQISDIKSVAKNIIGHALEGMKAQLDRLDPASFEHAIIARSSNEGCWEFDVLIRILLTLISEQIRIGIVDEGTLREFQEHTTTLRQIREVQSASCMSNEVLKKIYEAEVFEDGSYINKTYSQIANGDIFEIGGKEYMLVCQPCNLALRQNATRKINDDLVLLPIEKYPEDKNTLPPFYTLVAAIGGKQEYYVNLARARRVCPKVLDLVSYSKEGKAIIDLSKRTALEYENGQFMQPNMVKRYESIFKEINSRVMMHRAVCSCRERGCDKNQLKKFILNACLSSSGFIKPIISEDTNTIDFGVKRIKRSRKPYSLEVLQNFSGYLSRLAFPHDFSKFDE